KAGSRGGPDKAAICSEEEIAMVAFNGRRAGAGALNGVFFGLALAGAGLAAAQEAYPTRPIEFIVPWGPGGGADQVARKLGQLLEADLKVSLPVINVPGATGQTGHAKLMSANADGYSLEVMTGDTFALLSEPNAKIKMSDFIPLGIVIQQPSAFFVAEGSPMKTWADVEK